MVQLPRWYLLSSRFIDLHIKWPHCPLSRNLRSRGIVVRRSICPWRGDDTEAGRRSRTWSFLLGSFSVRYIHVCVRWIPVHHASRPSVHNFSFDTVTSKVVYVRKAASRCVSVFVPVTFLLADIRIDFWADLISLLGLTAWAGVRAWFNHSMGSW